MRVLISEEELNTIKASIETEAECRIKVIKVGGYMHTTWRLGDVGILRATSIKSHAQTFYKEK